MRSEWLEVASKQPKLALLREVMRKHEEPPVVHRQKTEKTDDDSRRFGETED